MSLAKIGNLVTALKTGEGLATSLKAFGSAAAAAAALKKYTSADIEPTLTNVFSKEEIDEAMQSLNATTTTSTVANVASGLKTSITSAFTGLAAKLGTSAAALGTTLGVAAGAALAVGVYKAWQNSLDKKVEEAHSAYTEYDTETKEIETQIEKVRELRAELDAGNLSSEEEYSIRSQILDIQNSIVDTYGSQAEGINLVNGALEKELGLVTSISSAEARKTYNDNEDGYERAYNKAFSEDTFYLGEYYPNMQDQENKNTIDEVMSILSEYEYRGVHINQLSDGSIRPYIEGTKYDIYDIATEINDRIQSLFDGSELSLERFGEKDTNFVSATFDRAVQEIYDKIEEDVNDNAETALEGLSLELHLGENKEIQDSYNAYSKAISEYNEAVLSFNPEDKSSLNDLIEAYNTYRAAYNNSRQYREYDDNHFNPLFKMLDESINAVLSDSAMFQASLTDGDLFDYAKYKIYKQYGDTLKESNLSAEDVFTIVDSAVNQTLGDMDIDVNTKDVMDIVDAAINDGIIDDTSFESIEYLISLLQQVGLVASEIEAVESDLFTDLFKGSTEEAETFDDIVDNFQSSISDINSAFESLKNGELTGSELTDLLQQFPELNNYLDDLNTGLTKISSDKILEVIKAVKEETAGITDEAEIQKVNQFIQGLIDQVDYTESDNSGLRQAIRDALFSEEDLSPSLADYRQQVYDELIAEFGDDDIALQAIAKIVLNPEVSLNTDDIKKQIDVEKIEGVIADALDNLEINDDSQSKHDSNVAYAESLRSYAETANGKLTAQDYINMNKELDEDTALLRERISLIDNILNSVDLNDPSTWGGLTKDEIQSYQIERMDLLSEIIDNNTQKVENNSDLNLLPLEELQEEYEILEAEQSLAQTKRDYKESTYGKLDTSDYQDLINEDAAKLESLTKQKEAAEEAIANATSEAAKKEAQDKYNEIQDDIYDVLQSQQEHQKDLNLLPLEELQEEYEILEAELQKHQNAIDLKIAQGIEPTVDDYQALFDVGEKMETNLAAQNEQLVELSENTDNLEFKAEYTDQIYDNEDAVVSLTQQYAEWSESIIDVTSSLSELDEALDDIDFRSDVLDKDISNKNDAGKFVSYDDYQQQYDLSEEREQTLIAKNEAAKDELYNNIVRSQDPDNNFIFTDEQIKSAQDEIRQTALEILDEQYNQESIKREQEQIPFTLYDNWISRLEGENIELEHKLDHVDELSSDEQYDLYTELIKNAEAISTVLGYQSSAYESYRDANYDNVNDPGYVEFTDSINSNTESINENSDNIAEWEKARNEIGETLGLVTLQKEQAILERNLTLSQNNLEDKETRGGMADADDYIELINHSKLLDDNLQLQKKELEMLIEKGNNVEEYQEQLEDIEDQIRDNKNAQYDWNKSLKNLPITNVNNLSSTLSTMFDELVSDTGITIDTVEELAAQFSNMADIDIQDALYRTADGLKIDTDMLQEFTDAQYKATMTDFEASIESQRKAIADYQKQIGEGNTDEYLASMQDNLEGLLNRQAQYFAAYKEEMEQFSKYNAIQIAKNTANAGDEYTSMLDEFETATEAYNNGLIGTDDFKTVAAYFSPNGFDDDKNFAENYSKIQRYLTEDHTGPQNFLNDLIAKGYASYDSESKQYKYNIPNMRKAALDMGIGDEFMESLFGRLEDYGFTNLFVSSLTEGTLKTEELSKELSEAKIRMAELQAQGADQNILDSQQAYIDELVAEQAGLQEAIKDWSVASTKDYIEGVVSGKDYINTLKEYADSALTTEEAQYYITEIQKYADEHGITLKADFSVDDDAYNELLSSLAIGSWENPLSAEDLGYKEGTKGAKVFLSTQNKVLDTYAENKEKLSELSKFTAAELYQLTAGLGNGHYDGDTEELHRAEDLLEEIKREANLTDEEVNTLVKTLISLGYIDNPEWEAKIDTTELDEAEKRAYYLQGGTISYQMSTNLTDGASELSSFVNGMTQGVSTSITVGVTNMEEAKSLVEILGNVPTDTSCTVNCSVSSQEELDYVTAQIAAYNEQNGTDLILNATLAGSDETAKSDINEVVEYANDSQAEITIKADTQKAFYAVNNAVNMINNKSATITIKADCFNLFKAVNTAIDMINKKSATITVYKKTATTGQVSELYTGTMTSVAARADGTVPYNVLNTTPISAYAEGRVSLPHDETALVNELGQESRISDGVWSLLPPGMHFENLKKGDIILNHKQTADLLKHGRASGTGHVRGYTNGTLPDDYIPAFASGTTSGNGGGSWGGALGTGQTLGSSSSSSSSNSTSDAVSDAAESAEDLFDWIEVLLTRLEAKTDSLIQKAENAITLSSSLKYYDKAIDNIAEQIAANEAGAARYKQQADSIELSSSIKKLVRTGKIDITKYSEETQDLISQYQEWYEKMLDCQQALADLQEQQTELAQSKIDAIIDKYDLTIERYEAYISKYEAAMDYRDTAGYSNVGTAQKNYYQYSIDKENTILEYYQKAQAKLMAEVESQLTSGLMTKGDDRWKEAQIQIQEYNTSIYEAKSAIEEWEQAIRAIKVTKLQRAFDKISRWADQLAGLLNLKEARGQNITESDYMSQVTANNDRIYAQYKLLNAYIEEQANYELGSEKWEEYAESIAECKNNINDLLVTNEELKDSIVEERWETFNKLQDEIDNTIVEIDYLRDALNSSLTSTGELTSDGYANISLIGEAISLEKQTIADYNKAIQKLNKEYKNGNIDQNEYNERLLEYQSIIRDAASAVEDYKNELIDLYKEQISARNDVLLENIELWKKAAEEQENYYDYSKQVKNQRKTIDSLKSQIAALNGVATAAGKAKLTKLQAELAEAEEDMADIKHDHEYELKISGYETLSDDVSKQFELIEQELETNAEMQQNVVNVMLENIKTGYSEAYLTINDLITETGLSISNTTTEALNGLTSVTKAAQLATEAIKEANQYTASSTASSVDTSKIVTNQTSSTSSSGSIITTNGAEKSAATTENTSNASTTKESSNSGTSTAKATSITLSKTSATIYVGKTVTLTVSCTPVNASVAYTWKSSSASVATVSNGTVKGVKAGSTTITVTDSVSGKTATCKVTVKAAATTTTSTSSSANSSSSSTTSTVNDIWKNIPKDTSMKGNSSLAKNTSIVDRMRYNGYTGNYTTQKQLWSNLKGSGTYTGTAAQNVWMIEQLKKAGYATGGIVSNNAVGILNKAARANGDDGIGILSAGETVMPMTFTELLPQGLKILEEVAKVNLPTVTNSTSQQPIVNTNLVFNVDQISNDIDLDAFSKKIQKEVSQNIVREVRKLR